MTSLVQEKQSLVQEKQQEVIKVTTDQLPACCPPKEQAQWNLHPRVYLELDKSRQASCPYCGNRFELADDD